jgi:hypothetical protein
LNSIVLILSLIVSQVVLMLFIVDISVMMIIS